MSLGPAVGGVLAQVLGYRPVFLAVAVALFLLLGPVLLILPRSRPNPGQISQAPWPV